MLLNRFIMKSFPMSASINASIYTLPLKSNKALPFALKNSSMDVGRFERLPKWLNCIPLVAQWLWLGLCYRSFTLPSTANPYITSGGMLGEGKLEYFDSMGALAKKYTAEYIAIRVVRNLTASELSQRMQDNNLNFPIIAKPNLGWCGYGVRLVSNLAELEKYLQNFPKGEMLVLQRYLPESGEAGLFYARNPGDDTGRIIGITLRYYPKVTGDGKHSIRELIAADKRLHRVEHSPLHQPGFNPDYIPSDGEVVRLATIGSTRVGGLYCDGSNHITIELDKAVDSIAKDMKEFYMGRFDVRFESLEQLKSGTGFTIMEVNGSGSEAIHAWDPKYSIVESYSIIFAKQRLLFAISEASRRNGHKPISMWELTKLHLYQQKLIKLYPLSN